MVASVSKAFENKSPVGVKKKHFKEIKPHENKPVKKKASEMSTPENKGQK